MSGMKEPLRIEHLKKMQHSLLKYVGATSSKTRIFVPVLQALEYGYMKIWGNCLQMRL